MKARSRPRRSKDKKGAGKINPRRVKAAMRRRSETLSVADISSQVDDLFNQP